MALLLFECLNIVKKDWDKFNKVITCLLKVLKLGTGATFTPLEI